MSRWDGTDQGWEDLQGQRAVIGSARRAEAWREAWGNGQCSPARAMITGKQPEHFNMRPQPSARSRANSQGSLYVPIGEPKRSYTQHTAVQPMTKAEVQASVVETVTAMLQDRTRARIVGQELNKRAFGRSFVEFRFDRPHGINPREINRLFGFDADVSSETTIKVY